MGLSRISLAHCKIGKASIGARAEFAFCTLGRHMTDDLLLSIWTQINSEHFNGMLNPLAEIAWLPLSDEEEGIEAFGIYFSESNAIAIDERFKPDEIKIAANDPRESAKLEVTYCLVLHEMVHQAAHQRRLPNTAGHGNSFISVATPVALSFHVDPPNTATASRWPDILPLLAQFDL